MTANAVLTAAQMQAAEQVLIDGGESVESLMERAGRGAAEWVWRMAAGRPATLLCGPGNNGGDGYVIARVLSERGLAVNVVAPVPPATDAAKAARAKWGGTPVERAKGEVLVDCLFGTGIARPLSDELVHLLMDLVVEHSLRVAVDLPSGVQSDTGGLLNRRLPRYDLTIALGAWKRAHWLMPAAAKMGERRLVDIGIPGGGHAVELAGPIVISAPKPDAHKYSRGMLLVIGGEMVGAGVLAARASQHSGAGYVKLLSEHSHPALPPDIVHIDRDPHETLADERIGAVLVGPGLGRGDPARNLLEAVLARNVPTVLDADALVLLTPDLLASDGSKILATPHEGELEGLCAAFGVHKESKFERARALHEATGMTVLAKGTDNILAGTRGTVLFPPATSWLSTAGTGDVLAGIAAGRMTTGDQPFAAAEIAVALHSEAARLAGLAFSAGDLIEAIPDAYRSFLP